MFAGIRSDVYHFDVRSDTLENSGTRAAGLLSPKFGVCSRPRRSSSCTATSDTAITATTPEARRSESTRRPANRRQGDAARARRTAGSSACERSSSRTSRRPSRSGVWVSIRSWCSSAMPARRRPDGQAGGLVWSGRTITVRNRGSRWTPTSRGRRLVSRTTIQPDRDSLAPCATWRLPASRSARWAASPEGSACAISGSVPSSKTRAFRRAVRSSSTPRLVTGGSRDAPVVDVINLFDARASDIENFYRSRLPGEPESGVDDVHTHPVAPRSARVNLRVDF